VCSELITTGSGDCPHCQVTADWIDLINALDFTIRRLHLWKLEGVMEESRFREVVGALRARREEMIEEAKAGSRVPIDSGLPSSSACWRCGRSVAAVAKHCPSCGAPVNRAEVRLLRQQAFLVNEVDRLKDAGLLTAEQAQRCIEETPEKQIEILARLEKEWANPLARQPTPPTPTPPPRRIETVVLPTELEEPPPIAEVLPTGWNTRALALVGSVLVVVLVVVLAWAWTWAKTNWSGVATP
jgi:RNA polymerase subunit RPABC4/transcription elongation factor Spt4